MLKIDIYQKKAHYRIPTIGNPLLSFPIVPPSTIYGFLREITNKESINFQNTKLAIYGKSEGVSFEIERLLIETKKEVKSNVIKTQVLRDVSTTVFVDTDSAFQKKILGGLKAYGKALRLGRREDLIIDIDILDNIEPDKFLEILENYHTYQNEDNKITGAMFRLPFDSLIDTELKITGYEFINLIYMPSTDKVCFIEGTRNN